MKTALITGVTGQDGCYLAKNLLDKGYKVYGAVKHTTGIQNWRLDEMGITNDIEYVDVDIVDQANIRRMIDKTKPDEVYNLAAQSFVALSFEQPEMAALIDGVGVLRMLETIYQVNPDIKFYQASTSELFGKVQEIPQNENTKFYPRSPSLVQNYMVIVLQLIIVRHIICTLVVVYYLIMNHRCEVQNLLLEK